MVEVNNAFVVLMGLGTVFFGLICIVFLCMAMSAVIKKLTNVIAEDTQNTSQTEDDAKSVIPNRQEIIAAVCAACAEELGEEVKNIKVLSFKRV